MPTEPAPATNLENARKRAKTLLKECRAGAPAALARVRAGHPRLSQDAGAGLRRIRLSDAQLVIARESGFSTWPEMVRTSHPEGAPTGAPPDHQSTEVTLSTANDTAAAQDQSHPATAAADRFMQDLLESLQALQRGELSHRMPAGQGGVAGKVATALDTHFDQMNHFTAELMRLGQDLTAGRFGTQMETPVGGHSWGLARGVLNGASGVLASQIRSLREAVDGLAAGDFAAEVRVTGDGEMRDLRDHFNRLLYDLRALRSEIGFLSDEVAVRGMLGGQLTARDARGEWREMANDANKVVHQITAFVRNLASVVTAISHGHHDKLMTVDTNGELLELKNVVNGLAIRLGAKAPA